MTMIDEAGGDPASRAEGWAGGSTTAPVERAVEHSVLHSHAGVTGHAHVEVVQVLRALAEPARLSVVHLLAEAPRRVTDLTGVLGLAQSTVSGHLAVLRDAGLVTATPQGRSTWYALVDAEVDGLLGAAERVVSRLAAYPDRSGRAGRTQEGRAS